MLAAGSLRGEDVGMVRVVAMVLLLMPLAVHADELLAPRLAAVEALAAQVQALAQEAKGAPVGKRKALAGKLDALLKTARFDRGLPVVEREEVAIRVAWKLEPAVHAATLALAGTETADDRVATRTREVAAQLYAWREEVRRATTPGPAPFARIAELLAKARPTESASDDALVDFHEVAEMAAWDLRRAMFPQDDPHATAAYNALVRQTRATMRAVDDCLKRGDDVCAVVAITGEPRLPVHDAGYLLPRPAKPAPVDDLVAHWSQARNHDMLARVNEFVAGAK